MKATRQPQAASQVAVGTASNATAMVDTRPEALAQRKLQNAVVQSPQARRMAQLRDMVEGSPAQLRQGGVVQRLTEEEARKRLGAGEGEQKNTVALLVDLHEVQEEIPKIENALGLYPAFLKLYPVRLGGDQLGALTQKSVRFILQKPVADLLNALPTFSDVLDGIEDWYMDATPEHREEAASLYLGDIRKMRNKFFNAAEPIATLFGSKKNFDRNITDHSGKKKIELLFAEIRMWFKNSSGFSAVGRAHKIKTIITPFLNEDEDNGFQEHESYLSGYYQGGSDPTSVGDKFKVTKQSLVPLNQDGPVIVRGQLIGLDPHEEEAHREERLEQTESGIADLDEGEWGELFMNPPAARDRGDGQYANMNKTNARGYAWLHAMPRWDTTAWEWLHVRAASLGGATDGSNLVLGTKDANTLMMPFESNIRLLSGLVKSYPDALSALSVQWSVEEGQMHAPNTIKITWNLLPKLTASKTVQDLADHASGEVVANLHTHSNLSKDEVVWIQDQLSGFRKELEAEQEEK